jgi:hypothetical protein
MKKTIPSELKEIINVQHYRPAVSIILPMVPKIALRTELEKELKYSIDQTGRQLRQQYPSDVAEAVVQKMRALTYKLDIPERKAGIALFASPLFGKIYFLDREPEKRLIIDESFEIRDLLFSQKQLRPHFLLMISIEKCKLFFSDGRDLLPVKMTMPDNLHAYWNDSKERVANFTDPSAYKSIAVEKFFRQMDKELIQALKPARYPVFLLGSKPSVSLFQTLSNANAYIKGTIEGNYETASLGEMQSAVRPAIENWIRNEEHQMMAQIEEAENKKQLAAGIEAVWNAAVEKKGKLLIVEKNYVASGEHISAGKIVYKPTSSHNDFRISSDIVDDTMESVLQYGGDIAFVEDGLLSEYGHIVLIKYFP